MPSMTLTCAICNLPMQKSRTSRPQGEAVHNKCRYGEEFTRSPAGVHGVSGYQRGCRCDVCREGQRVSMGEYEKKRRVADGIGASAQYKRSQRGVDPHTVVNCFSCSEPLVNVRTGAGRYPLHKACRQTAPEWMRRGWDKPDPAVHARRRKIASFQAKIDKAARGSAGKRVFTCGGCQWCGAQFVGLGVYCSKKCAGAVKFKRQSSGKSFTISPRKRAEIYERDEWTCQLCKFPVEQGLHYLNDWAPSLDHIIPRAATLIPDHSPSNLQLAHRMCNSMKGDGSNMTESEFHGRIAVHFSVAA